MSTEDRSDGGNDDRSADERALAALFASLVDDAPASEVSPDEVIELARNEQRGTLDRRIKRLKYGRNLLLAAALAALVVIVLPKLGSSSSETAAASSSSAPAAAPAAASSAAATSAAAAAAVPGEAGSGTFAASGAASGAASSGAASAGQSDDSSAAASAPAASAPTPLGSAPASAAAAASSAATTAGARQPTGVPQAECVPLPDKALAAARGVLPTDEFGNAPTVTSCADTSVPAKSGSATLTGSAGQKLTISANQASPGACTGSTPVCSPVPGVAGAYRHVTAASTTIWVYGNGYQVALTRTGGSTTATERAEMIAAGKAVIRALG